MSHVECDGLRNWTVELLNHRSDSRLFNPRTTSPAFFLIQNGNVVEIYLHLYRNEIVTAIFRQRLPAAAQKLGAECASEDGKMRNCSGARVALNPDDCSRQLPLQKMFHRGL